MNARVQSERAKRRGALVVSALLAAASVMVPMVAVPALFVFLFSLLFQKHDRPGDRRRTLVWALLGGAFLTIGMVRFIVDEAMPGIVEGGRRAQAKMAVSLLREMVFAQDVAREQAMLDPDGDGVGSALALEALLGQNLRNGKPAVSPLLPRFGRLQASPVGKIATASGYGIVLYLPTNDGKGSAQAKNVDDEAAERRFVAYAWPLERGHAESAVVFIDEHEQILISDNLAPTQGYFGAERPPPFDAALLEARVLAPAAREARGQDGGTWTPWKGKRPRAALPGDRTAR